MQCPKGIAVTYTQVRITRAYRDKLATLANQERRSMARQLEVLIDQAIGQQSGIPNDVVEVEVD